MTTTTRQPLPDTTGHFGAYGGKFVPETLMQALAELEEAYLAAKEDESFHAELQRLSKLYVGRPTPLYHAENLSKELGGAQIYLKREDLAHTGAHKINNALGQVLVARRMGKQRIVAETGAGQHGAFEGTFRSDQTVASEPSVNEKKCLMISIHFADRQMRHMTPRTFCTPYVKKYT